MDVHPPHSPLHSWRDFWIHLGTISVGLLIAISLEQTVEWANRLHERHVLQAELREEGESNREVVATDLKDLDLKLRWAGDLARDIAQIRDSHGTLKLPLRPNYSLRAADFRYHYLNPGDAVWTTAKDGNRLALLPHGDAQVYARLERLSDFVIEAWKRTDLTAQALDAFAHNFHGGLRGVDLSLMNDAQLERFNDLLQTYFEAESRLYDLLHYFNGTNEAILGGARTEAEVQQAMYAAAAQGHAVAHP
jgi:hypothetical protein